MALGSSDERDLILPLFAGIREDPPWHTFLQRLRARTGARRIALSMTASATDKRPLLEYVVAAPDAGNVRPLDISSFSDSVLLAYGSLRPGRVYSLDELLILDNTEEAQRQRAAFQEAETAFARFIRIAAPSEHSVWLFLVHDRQDFTAADSALLSALAPHVTLAVSLLLEADTLRLRAAMAEEALARIGVGQAALDAEGRVVVADGIAARALDVQAGARPVLRGRSGHSLNAACQELAEAPAPTRRIVRIDEREGRDMILRPAPAGSLPGTAAAVGLVRQNASENAASAARTVAATLGLSAREAALAVAMSRGKTIVEAGAELQLTPETARNYTKRIYAKTGAAGQADLVRIVLNGLAPFA